MKKLNYKFNDPKLLELALTQSGADAFENNERLEFLGDRVLGLAMANLLYEMFPNESEGALAQRHAALVSTDSLAMVAKSFGFDRRVRHGHMTAGKLKHMMADAMESVLGAVFLDGGFAAAQKFVAEIWTDIARADVTPPKDPKTTLQEMVQKLSGGGLPEYSFEEATGPSHSPIFHATVSAMNKSASGTGTSKKSAAAVAAAELIKLF